MNTQHVESKTNKAFYLAVFLLLPLLLVSCAAPATPPSFGPVEELTFQSGEFKVVGDLRLPAGDGPFPVVLFVHGDGPADRTGMLGLYVPIMDRMLLSGFATFAWDKPGTGESTGELGEPNLRHKRAQILLDAIELMKTHPEIDPKRIGVWGASQAGYVIPIALTQTEDIAFVICVSCPGESGYDQMAFQVMASGLCQGLPKEKTAEMDRLWKELEQYFSYETYPQYVAYRETSADLTELVPASLDNWPVVPEDAWLANPIEEEDIWNPVSAIRQVDIPVLAIYGDKDSLGDPFQGAYAYQKALSEIGNPKSRVEVIPNADHIIINSKTGCMDELQKTVLRSFLWFAISHGATSPEQINAEIAKDPYKPGLLDFIPFAPGYLDLIEDWLTGLQP